jgi:hypothetical protein
MAAFAGCLKNCHDARTANTANPTCREQKDSRNMLLMIENSN